MGLIDSVEFALAIAALAVSLAALFPIIRQAYLDRVSPWPYEVVFVGRLKDPIGPWIIALAFRFKNHTRNEAFFEVRLSGEGIFGRELPFYISVWPSQEKVGIYLPVAPSASREVRISPFGPQDSRNLKSWTLSIIEYSHRNRPIVLAWPGNLDHYADGFATDIPVPPSH
ncbi:MAG: hypothetical protein ACLP78_00800 [Thermoplasmata archaeon]